MQVGFNRIALKCCKIVAESLNGERRRGSGKRLLQARTAPKGKRTGLGIGHGQQQIAALLQHGDAGGREERPLGIDLRDRTALGREAHNASGRGIAEEETAVR